MESGKNRILIDGRAAAEITRTSENQVWVKPLRASCQGCAGSCSLPGSAASSREAGIPLTVRDPAKWSPGDRVLLATPESFLLVTSLMVYGLPLLGLLAGAMLGATSPSRICPNGARLGPWPEHCSVSALVCGWSAWFAPFLIIHREVSRSGPCADLPLTRLNFFTLESPWTAES